MSVTQIQGLVSGLDTASLIDALVAARSGPIRLLEQRQAAKTTELTAWKSFETVLVALKIETERLGDRSLWEGLSVTSSDEEHVTASADAGTAVGSWDFFVEQLAGAHQVQSQAYASSADLVGSGTFTLTRNGIDTEIQVAAGTTLADLADLVNEADAGVTATLVRSEAAGDESFHLVLVADETGEENRFTVDTSGLTGGTSPDLATSVTDGRDAVIRLGGPTGLEIRSGTNTFRDVIEGLDLTVHKTHEPASTERATISVDRDAERIASRVEDFVAAYNALAGFVNAQFRYDQEVGVRPPLMGSSLLTTLSGGIRRGIFSPIGGLGEATFRTLRGIGLETGQNGTLTFDTSAFHDALDEDWDAVANLFRANATFDAEGVSWISAPADLELGERAVAVEITAAATRARLEGGSFDLGAGLVIDDTNDELEISLDGVRSETLRIAHGTYADGDELAAAIRDALDASDDLGALTADVSFEGTGGSGQLVLTSTKFGSAASIELHDTGNGLLASLGLAAAAGEAVAGTDVEGTIDGEAATGNGRVLTADDDTALAGLAFQVTAAEAGSWTASFTEGVGRSMTRRLGEMTDSADGTLSRITGSVQGVIDRYARQIEQKTEQLDVHRASLERKYAALESLLGQLQSQGAFLAAQVQSFQSLNGSQRGR